MKNNNKGEKKMKKLLSIILTTVMIMSAMAIPAFADQPYYPCYEGTWNIKENSGTPIKLKISNVNSNNMDIYFQYGQFAINTTGKIDGKKVNANYREVWEGGDFIVKGTINLDLGDQGIWLDWHGYENGRDCGTTGYMFYKDNFKYTNISDSDVKVVLNGEQLSFEQNPVILNDGVLVPMRTIFESMGAEVDWYTPKKGNSNRSATATLNSKSIVFEVDSSYMSITALKNGQATDTKKITLNPPTVLYNGYTMVPVRAVSEAFGASVKWDGDSRTVYINN